jgi:hypothetical protein
VGPEQPRYRVDSVGLRDVLVVGVLAVPAAWIALVLPQHVAAAVAA